MRDFFEEMFFSPAWYHYFVIILLYPLSIVYGILMLVWRLTMRKHSFSIPIISVGNIFVGGTGKTPFVIALAQKYEGVSIISRGYGRESKGLIEVSVHGEILSSVENSGDEPMLMAQSLPNASVIVSENRLLAIELARRKEARMIILDDGFSQVSIDKFDIVLEPSCPPNTMTFPAGPFREFGLMKHYADLVLKEDSDFKRAVSFENLTQRMLLVTAIGNPQRLEKYLPDTVIAHYYLEDHAYFDESVLREQLKLHGASSLLVTQKDAVKMKGFKLPLSLMKLELKLKDTCFRSIDNYLERYNVR